MPRRAKLIVGIFIILSMAVVLAWIRQGSVVRLKDGSTWQLEDVTHGTVHRKWVGSAWHTPLAALPAHWAETIAGKPLYETVNTKEPTIAIWGRFLETKSTSLIFALHSSNIYSPGGEFGLKPGRVRIILDSWPRHADRFDIVWLSRTSPREAVGSVTIKNPMRSPASTPVRPADWTQGPLQIKGAVSIHSEPDGIARIKVSVSENNQPSTNYAIAKLEIEDRVGNKRDLRFQPTLNYEEVIRTRPLWAPELGWIIRGEVAQVSGFGNEQTVVFTNFPLPAMREPLARSRVEAALEGGVLVLEASSGTRPGILLRMEQSTNSHWPQIVSVVAYGGGRLRTGALEGKLENTNEVFFPRSFTQKRADITCGVGDVHTFVIQVLPSVH